MKTNSEKYSVIYIYICIQQIYIIHNEFTYKNLKCLRMLRFTRNIYWFRETTKELYFIS